MSLAIRIIPTLLTRHGNLVKGVKFDSRRIVGNAYQAAMIHQARSVDELIVLDVAATPEGTEPDTKMISRLTNKCFMPITVGGGVKTVEHVRELLASGADKVVIRSAASYKLVHAAAERFGSQAVVVSCDIDRRSEYMSWVEAMIEAGAGELMIGNPERDGTLSGYDIPLIRDICSISPVPVIATHGCGTYEHMAQAIDAGASAVAAGAMFQFLDLTPKGAALYLQERGYEVRVPEV